MTEQSDEDLGEAGLGESPFPTQTSFIKDNRTPDDRWRESVDDNPLPPTNCDSVYCSLIKLVFRV